MYIFNKQDRGDRSKEKTPETWEQNPKKEGKLFFF